MDQDENTKSSSVAGSSHSQKVDHQEESILAKTEVSVKIFSRFSRFQVSELFYLIEHLWFGISQWIEWNRANSWIAGTWEEVLFVKSSDIFIIFFVIRQWHNEREKLIQCIHLQQLELTQRSMAAHERAVDIAKVDSPDSFFTAP